MHVGSSSLTRDRTQALFIGGVESYPQEHQGSPKVKISASISLVPLSFGTQINLKEAIVSFPFAIRRHCWYGLCPCWSLLHPNKPAHWFLAISLHLWKQLSQIESEAEDLKGNHYFLINLFWARILPYLPSCSQPPAPLQADTEFLKNNWARYIQQPRADKSLLQTLKSTYFKKRSGKVYHWISENFEALKHPFQRKGFRIPEHVLSNHTYHWICKCMTPNCSQALLKLEICAAWRSLSRRKSCRYVSCCLILPLRCVAGFSRKIEHQKLCEEMI